MPLQCIGLINGILMSDVFLLLRKSVKLMQPVADSVQEDKLTEVLDQDMSRTV